MSELDTLRALPIFAGLTDAQLDRILSVVQHRRVPAGTAILREGSPSGSLYVLKSGSVEVTKRMGSALAIPTDDAKEKTLIRLEAPQFFGEMGLLENTERSATITARGECELIEITKEDFERLVEEDYVLAYHVVRNVAIVLSSRLRRTDRDLLKLTTALSLALGNR